MSGYQTAADGLYALLNLAKESSDAVGIAKGVLGGIVYIIDTAKKFKSNAKEWEELATYVEALQEDINNALAQYSGSPPASLTADIKKLHLPLLSIAKEMGEMKNRSKFSKFLQTREDPAKIQGFRQTVTSSILKFNVVRLVSIERKLDTIIATPSATKPLPAKAQIDDDEPVSFNLRVNKELWPEFSPGDNSLNASGQLYLDFVPDSWRRRYANGEETGGQFGHSVFPSDRPRPTREQLPVRLFDLWTNRVVQTGTLDGPVEGYSIISHVWGEKTVTMDGREFGVEWDIPIRRHAKLEQLLNVARVIGGLRYVWIDVLCLDQRPNGTREAEIPRMAEYFANAAGCIVWLDNVEGDLQWEKVLSAIKDINAFFNQDKAGIPTISVQQMLQQGLMNMTLNGTEGFKLLKRILTIENAPWFRRVWTLQEAVIPNSIYLCTPERYLLNGSQLFQLLGLCGLVAKLFMESGEMGGIALLHELQKSEAWKLLRLRQLWRARQLGYWHLNFALRSRKTRFEHDRVFATLGLLPAATSGPAVVDYKLDAAALFRDLWRQAVERNEFGALTFLGDAYRSGAPNESCTAQIVPFVDGERPPETHALSLRANGVHMENVGVDRVTTVYAIVTNGSLRSWEDPSFLDLTTNIHINIAKAFGVSTEVVKSAGAGASGGEGPESETGALCPAAFAAISAMRPLTPDLLKAFGDKFAELYASAIPRGLLMWIRTSILFEVCQEGYGFVVLTTEQSEPQLGLVTEKVEGTVVVVTPSSYVEHPGVGCIICKVTPSGDFKKIGLGLGDVVKASMLTSALLI